MLKVVRKHKLWATIWAFEANHARLLPRLLQSGLQCLAETVAAKLMSCLQTLHWRILNICENSFPDLPPGVVLFFSTPVIKAHTFFFEFLFVRQQSRLAILELSNGGVCLNGDLLKLYELSLSLGGVSGVGNCRASIYKRLENSNRCGVDHLATFNVGVDRYAVALRREAYAHQHASRRNAAGCPGRTTC